MFTHAKKKWFAARDAEMRSVVCVYQLHPAITAKTAETATAKVFAAASNQEAAETGLP